MFEKEISNWFRRNTTAAKENYKHINIIAQRNNLSNAKE